MTGTRRLSSADLRCGPDRRGRGWENIRLAGGGYDQAEDEGAGGARRSRVLHNLLFSFDHFLDLYNMVRLFIICIVCIRLLRRLKLETYFTGRFLRNDLCFLADMLHKIILMH
jgi:hypothetical protein